MQMMTKDKMKSLEATSCFLSLNSLAKGLSPGSVTGVLSFQLYQALSPGSVTRICHQRSVTGILSFQFTNPCHQDLSLRVYYWDFELTPNQALSRASVTRGLLLELEFTLYQALSPGSVTKGLSLGS
eukprot:1158485-Pelagomonas_calceolata.AAC.12